MSPELRNRLAQKAIDESMVAIDFMRGAEWMHKEEVVPLLAKLEKAKEALRFYAKESSWKCNERRLFNAIDMDDVAFKHFEGTGGKRARAALKEIEGEK